MSSALFASVTRLYQLLDLDANAKLDGHEARLGFSACFADVHRSTERLDSKDSVVDAQVSWLFSATAHDGEGDDAEITEEEFKACYSKLLQAAYEEEVLQLDLNRAIDSLSKNAEWSQMHTLFSLVRSSFDSLTGDGHSAIGTLSLRDGRSRSVVERMAQGITGRSDCLGPKKQTAARKIVAKYIEGEGEHQMITIKNINKMFKELLRLGVPVDSLIKDVQQALNLAKSDTSTSTSSSSSSASDPASSPSSTTGSTASVASKQ